MGAFNYDTGATITAILTSVGRQVQTAVGTSVVRDVPQGVKGEYSFYLKTERTSGTGSVTAEILVSGVPIRTVTVSTTSANEITFPQFIGGDTRIELRITSSGILTFRVECVVAGAEIYYNMN